MNDHAGQRAVLAALAADAGDPTRAVGAIPREVDWFVHSFEQDMVEEEGYLVTSLAAQELARMSSRRGGRRDIDKGSVEGRSMRLDGFTTEKRDAFVGYSTETSDWFFAIMNALARRYHVEVEGLDRLPKGRAVLVANHAFGFWDLALAIARIRSATGRTVWGLGEHLWWRVPIVRRLAASVGVVDGTPENADALLARDELSSFCRGSARR